METPVMTQPVSIRLNNENKVNIDRFAKITKRSRSFVINEAVTAYLKDRIRYLDELDEAIVDAQSGYGHSSEQIHAWLESWGTENERPVPSPDISPGS